MHSWIFLATAILLEVAGTTSMKLAEGFSKFWPSLMIFVCYSLSFAALTFALKRIDLGVAYAVWAGLGTALIALIGIAFFKEPFGVLKLVSIGLIITGVVGLNLAGAGH
jgi:small multidrug resistance pump